MPCLHDVLQLGGRLALRLLAGRPGALPSLHQRLLSLGAAPGGGELLGDDTLVVLGPQVLQHRLVNLPGEVLGQRK